MDRKQGIFRAEAWQRYMRHREEMVLPRLVRPKVFIFLWVGLALLLMGSGVAWLMQVPIYVSGTAVVVFDEANHEAGLLIFVPAQSQTQLAPAQNVWLTTEKGEKQRQQIIEVQADVFSPETASEQFPQSYGLFLDQPVAVALADFAPLSVDQTLALYVGSRFAVDIEVDSQRVIALIPVVGSFFVE